MADAVASDAVRRSGFPVIRDVIEAGGLPIGLPDATRRAAMVKVRRVEADITTVSQKLSELPTWLWLLTRACLARRMDYLAGLMYPDESAPAHAESLVRTALEASRVRPRFARAPCGARVRTSGAVSAADCEQGGTCSPLGAATFPP